MGLRSLGHCIPCLIADILAFGGWGGTVVYGKEIAGDIEQFHSGVNSNYIAIVNLNEVQISNEVSRVVFPPVQDPARAIALLKVIRDRSIVDCIGDLRVALTQMQSNRIDSAVKQFNPSAGIPYEVEATIESLEMDQQGIVAKSARADHLLAIISKKLASPPNPINAEMLLLAPEATELTPKMWSVFDSDPDIKIKGIALLVLSSSKAGTLETDILRRIEEYQQQESLYAKMLVVLGKVGSLKGVEYLSKLTREGQGNAKAVAILSLERLSKEASEPAVREHARQALLLSKPPPQPPK